VGDRAERELTHASCKCCVSYLFIFAPLFLLALLAAQVIYLFFLGFFFIE